jgi:hypothetical protein
MTVTTADKIIVTVIVFCISVLVGWLEAMRKRSKRHEDVPFPD